MSPLVDFLLARIAEDEAMARAAVDPERPGTHWRWFDHDTDRPLTSDDFQQDGGYTAAYLATTEEFPTTSGVGPLPAFALSRVEELEGAGPHIARWDPARVLAECDAKRRIIELHKRDRLGESCDVCRDPYEFEAEAWPCDTLRLLALPYADHPDYRPEWRPAMAAAL